MQTAASNDFLAAALAEMPRLLGQLNRNPASHTYGSFDRAYWHYRTNDISCARYQEAVYTLALLYCSEFEENIFFHDEKLFEWIRAALAFTAGLQQKNGSFDEWYVNEGSYVATAFVSAVLAQTVALLQKEKVDLPEGKLILIVLEKAACFLMNRTENVVMNQVSGAIFAIASAGRLVRRSDFISFADRLLGQFLAQQNKEGWWSEYGGPDIGYLSLTVNYLEKYQTLKETKEVSEAIQKAKLFIEQFIHPDRTVGGEYMSRNTEYLIPSAALPYMSAVGPNNIDDRYLCYLLYNWIEIGLKVAPQAMIVSAGERFFPESSLLRAAHQDYFLIVNGKKGGSFRLYTHGRVYYDSGLEVIAGTTNFSSGILDVNNEVLFQEGNMQIFGSMKKIKEPLMETKIAIAFKLWQYTFGRISFFQKVVKNFLRPLMISYAGNSKNSFERTICYSPEAITVTDRLCGPAASHMITVGTKAAYNAVPSSKYAAVPELQNRLLLPKKEESRSAGEYRMRRTFFVHN